MTPAEFGDSDALQVGDAVVAIGDPLGTQLLGTMTDGIISAINRDLAFDGRTLTLLQTNAALNSGNSGGPLINMQGQVIGVNTMKLSATYSATAVEGLGFAIPISTAKRIVDELLSSGYVAGRPAIGITGETVPMTARAYYRLPAGVYIRSIDKASDAYTRGLQPGDIITAFNGTSVTSMDDLNAVKNQCQAGDTVQLRIYRSGVSYELDLVLMDAAAERSKRAHSICRAAARCTGPRQPCKLAAGLPIFLPMPRRVIAGRNPRSPARSRPGSRRR